MDHRKVHLWEKLHVELVGGLALVAVYYWLWPLVGWTDTETAFAFLATGHFRDAAGLILLLLLTSVFCAAATLAARPMGSMLATLVGICGVSCRSPGMRTVFWARPDTSPASLFALMAAEALLLGALFCLAAVVVEVVRAAISHLAPRWVWKDPLAPLTPDDRLAIVPQPPSGGGVADALLPGPLQELFVHFGRKGSRDAGLRTWDRPMFARCLACAVSGALVAVLPLLILTQSSERGQVLFALLVSFLLGGLVAHQRFPAPYSVVAILMVAFTAAAFYATAAIATAGLAPGANVWMATPVHAGPSTLPYAAALPIDWLTAGGGGAVIGFWISERIHELRYVEDDADAQTERDF